MARVQLRNKRNIEDYTSPYVIAEVNTSHFGSFELAIEMVKKVSQAGADCVKFQSWSEHSLYSQTYYDENPIAKRFIQKFSLSNSQLSNIASYCKSIGIDFASTPYSISEIDFLVEECDVPFLKVPSMDINNLHLLRYLARRNVPIVLSTGMSTLGEIRTAVETLASSGNTEIVILHCVSLYPTDVSDVNLRNIDGLRKAFPEFPIGFSDHSLGTEVSIASVALGAAVIEKHFTLDSSAIGMDNQMAIEAGDLQQLINSCRNVSLSLGQVERNVTHAEMEQRSIMRRSAVTVRSMSTGEIVDFADVCFKRPGSGITPENVGLIVGKRLRRDLMADVLFSNDDFEH